VAASIGLLTSRGAPPKAADAARRGAPATAAVPPPVEPAFTPGPATLLRRNPYASRYAPVLRATAVRARPSSRARTIATLATRTPEGTDNIVQVLARRPPYVKAELTNGATGWVPRTALGGYATVTTRLDIDLNTLTATLYRDGKPVLRAPVGVGAAGTPTPAGRFYIRDKLTRYSSPAYGPVAFGTSAQSPTITDWPAGGYVGIHGTDRPDLLPGRISHGCIRLRNADILRLAKLMPVGTPLEIR
jgi:lipoprotein-anchoring transpeptidase ErfK/SrfK